MLLISIINRLGIKQIALHNMWVGLIQSVEGLSEAKMWIKRESHWPQCLEQGGWPFLAFAFELKHQLLSWLEPPALELEIWFSGLQTQTRSTHQFPWVSILLPIELGTFQPP
jgi:hypothetical protein